MNVAMRIDTSLKIDLGHIMVCLTLANITFIFRKLKRSLIYKIQS